MPSPLSPRQQERHTYLHTRLTDVTLTPNEFKEYCYIEALRSGALANGLVLPDLDLFVTDAMLLQYWQAVDWWPRDLHGHPCPTLSELAMQAPHMPGGTALTLEQLLVARGTRCAAALREAKMSVVNPNESKAERRRRLNRERQRRHVAAKKPVSVAGEGEGAVAAVRDPQAEIANAREAMRAEMVQVDAWVRAAHVEMQARAKVRKERKAYWTGVIEGLKQTGG